MFARLITRLALAACLIVLAALVRPGGGDRAEAQGVSISVEFRQALAPHGRWQRHDRWGEVWIPARVDREWRPYSRGHWVWTEEWGWYWVSDEEWGWVAYHYGRWVFDRQVGWIWVPGNEWGPAWVSWRRGDSEVGWAALPPDDLVDEIEANPSVWVFVRTRDLIAPNIVRVVLPRQRTMVLVRETVVVNRTVFVSGARVAANIGVRPSFVAAAIGRPIRVSTVQPVVVRGTLHVQGAIEADANNKQRRRAVVKNAERTIQPAKDVPKPERVRTNDAPDANAPDTPNVLRQSQDKRPDGDKKELPSKQEQQIQQEQQKKGSDDRPKADRKDDAAPKTKQKQDDDDRPKAQRKDDAAPKTKQKQDDDDRPKAQRKDDAAPKTKQDADDRPKAQPNRDVQPKAAPQQQPDAQPKAAPKQQPEAQPKAAPEPQQKGPPAKDGGDRKKDNN